ncbi:MAG: OsmC family protein [Solirubrobacterales bacterium]|nr:OsmC family protein [Solirubrobacterales bacterium]
MARLHTYDVRVTWTGDRGTGTSGYREFARDHQVAADGPVAILGSSDPALAGDRTRWNPEQLLTAALSQCHMLWYLHLCAESGVLVTAYVDDAHGEMEERHRGGRFTRVVLRPRVTISSAKMLAMATELHEQAHDSCFIASSVNFPVSCEPKVDVE